LAENRIHNDVTLTTLFKKSEMTASEHEVHDAMHEGVQILDEVMPVEVLVDEKTGQAYALKMAKCTMKEGRPEKIDGTEFIIEADLIVAAIGQGGVLDGLEEFNNGKNLIDADKNYTVPGKPGHFVAGDIIRPHLLTTAIGQGSIVAESIDQFLKQTEEVEFKKRPKVDVHHFDLLEKLKESGLKPAEYEPGAH